MLQVWRDRQAKDVSDWGKMRVIGNLKIDVKKFDRWLSLNKITYDPVCPSVGRSVVRLVGRPVVISLKAGKLHFYAPLGAFVFIVIYH